MEPKFRVNLDVETGYDSNADLYFVYLKNVTPDSLSIQCPHCDVYSVMHLDSSVARPEWHFDLLCTCAHCRESVFVKAKYNSSGSANDIASEDSTSVAAVYPQSRKVNVPSGVPEKYGIDYRESVLVLDLSPKASAALSRRILQNIIREEFGISRRSLDKEIEDFINLKDVPSSLAESVDAIRAIGNFAAHPLKDTNTGEIVEVEPGEAEWLLEVLEQLFDFAFVQPKKLKEKRHKLNEKLQSAGKPALKTQKP